MKQNIAMMLGVVAILCAVIALGVVIAHRNQSWYDMPVLTAEELGGTRGAGSITLGGAFLPSTTQITVTNGYTLTASDTNYILDAGSAVTLTLATCTASGRPLYLYANDAQTVTVADANIYTTDGAAIALTQYDTAFWVCNGSKWALISKSANQ